MKKLVLMMVGLFLISSAYAQDKAALKAQKEAEKEAKATFKKAKSTYETSIPNEAFGRKETDFEKLATAVPLIESAIQNEFTNKDMDTWKVASDIQQEFYNKENNEVKADPDNEQLKKNFLETGSTGTGRQDEARRKGSDSSEESDSGSQRSAPIVAGITECIKQRQSGRTEGRCQVF